MDINSEDLDEFYAAVDVINGFKTKLETYSERREQRGENCENSKTELYWLSKAIEALRQIDYR